MADLFDEFGIEYNQENNNKSSHPYLKNILHSLGGLGIGLAQGGSDIGANIAQAPSDLYTWATGKPGYKAPKPDIREFAPQSEAGKMAEHVGEFAAPFAAPGMAAEAVGLYGAKLLPRLIANALAGSAESENRGLGALFGAATPAIAGTAKAIYKTPLTKTGATRRLNKAEQLGAETENLDLPLNMDFMRNLEYQMGSKHLKPAKEQLNTLIGNAAKGDYRSYHELQSALGDISRELRHPALAGGTASGLIKHLFGIGQSTAAERLTGKQLEKLRHDYIADVLKHMQESGHGKLAKLEKGGREDYARYMKFKPFRNAIMGSLLIGAGVPGAHFIKHHL